MNKKIIWAILILIVFGGGYYFFNSKMSNVDYDDGYTSITNTASSTNATTSSVATVYTLADVSTHSSSASCWSAIEGKVYDLTSWIGKHPGGDKAILSICGKDGTQAFDGKHGMDPRAKGALPNFFLGNLAN